MPLLATFDATLLLDYLLTPLITLDAFDAIDIAYYGCC